VPGPVSVAGAKATSPATISAGISTGARAAYAPPSVPLKRKRSPRQLVLARRNCMPALSSAGHSAAMIAIATSPAIGE